MTQPCFGTEFYTDGIFCKACSEKEACEQEQMKRHNIPGPKNIDVGNQMFESHIQEVPALLLPRNGNHLTPELAVKMLKKKKAPLPDDGIRRQGRASRLKIPYASGSALYVRAYYWCKKLNKTFPEIQEEFEAGKLGYAPKGSIPPVSTAPEIVPGDKTSPPGMVTISPSGSEPITASCLKGTVLRQYPPLHKILAGTILAGTTHTEKPTEIEELTKFLRATSTVFATMSQTLSSMDNNILELRKEIVLLRGDMRKYTGGKHRD